jgi:Na+/H+ antiporter NhaD/arsenite permease-like protein
LHDGSPADRDFDPVRESIIFALHSQSESRGSVEWSHRLTTTSVIFLLVYLGMLLGGLPFLQLDRTGIALLGAIALLVSESLTLEAAMQAIHMPTLILLFSFMVVSAQLRLGGFYDWVTARIGTLKASPPGLLAALIMVVAGLSAVFSNDVVCLSMAPVLIEICLNRCLNPVPFLLALACAANVGSAATLIGNPQNMLIGAKLGLSFADYLKDAAVPVLAGMIVTWLVIVGLWRGRWIQSEYPSTYVPVTSSVQDAHPRELNVWQAAKGLAVAATLFTLFLFSGWPREMLSLGGAGLLLLSRRLHSRDMLGLVDWEVLVLFIGLFIINDAFERTGLPGQAVAGLAGFGMDLHRPDVLYGVTFLLSNLVSNVPAVMLLLPVAAPRDGALLALSSTFAGNLLVIGSVANIIVIETAARHRIPITWRQHALVGVPVTLLTLGFTAALLL